eukprot:TRINITY_DN16885_c0_g1_i2.p1 TRINITY_DN16885_c0_g1~~TRINITY_DN16885_c0_g1_i2.p1  ORF type:complete len:122 (-),score=22.52 TRINITY_DN16885_c0_g1_i2:125-490(-)
MVSTPSDPPASSELPAEAVSAVLEVQQAQLERVTNNLSQKSQENLRKFLRDLPSISLSSGPCVDLRHEAAECFRRNPFAEGAACRGVVDSFASCVDDANRNLWRAADAARPTSSSSSSDSS